MAKQRRRASDYRPFFFCEDEIEDLDDPEGMLAHNLVMHLLEQDLISGEQQRVVTLVEQIAEVVKSHQREEAFV